MIKLKGRGVIAQSGGPTRVINQSLVGAILEAYKHKDIITELWGSLNGPEGVVKGEFIDLYRQRRTNLRRVARTPSAALASSREKIGDEKGNIPPEQFAEALIKDGIRFFFYIGGGDSADNALTIEKICEDKKYDIKVFHIPKTIDNDLLENDHCPGYGSAARFVVCALMGDDRDNYSLVGVKINVVMGRYAGWLTAASSLARKDEGYAPHLIYVPERGLTLDKFLIDVESAYKRYGRVVVAVSEGINDMDGVLWAEKIAKVLDINPFGHPQLSGTGTLGDFLANQVKATLKIKRVRADTFGYLQRSYAGDVSDQDAIEAEDVGREAVKLAVTEMQSGSVVIRRKQDIVGYDYELGVVPLEKVAKGIRFLEAKYISADGNDIKPEFKDYARPLLGKGLPEIVTLDMIMVK